MVCLLVVLSHRLSEREQANVEFESVSAQEVRAFTASKKTSQSLWDLWKEGKPVLSAILSMTSEEARNAFMDAETLEEGHARDRIQKWSFDRWSELEPMSAMDWAMGQLTDTDGIAWVLPLVRQWAVDDPDSCLEWLDRQHEVLSEELLKSQGWERLVKSSKETRHHHPPTEQELDRVWTLLEDADKDTYFNAGRTKVDRDEVELAWPLIHVARETDQWEATMTRLLALEHPSQAILWPVVQPWVEHDFDAATTWAATLPEGKTRDDVIRSMSYSPNGDRHQGSFDRKRLLDLIYEVAPDKIAGALLSADNPAVISQWLQRHPESTPDLDSVRSSFAKKLGENDNEAAIAWASTIQDPSRKLGALERMTRYWYRVEPWAAEAWAKDNLGWSDEKCAEEFKHYR